MFNDWLTPYNRNPMVNTVAPWGGYFNEFDRLDRDMNRMMMNTMNWANKTLNETHRFGELCPEVVDNDKEFKVKMDVSHFNPNELKVTVKDNYLQVEGDHEEKSDKYGTIKRSFVRKYALPKGLNEENVKSELTKDGMLTVGGSKLALEEKKGKNVPIEFKN
uniref:SHSP domain-containing protein n=1 Tax=Strongyloides papillosus TaxID=174720 RepID=A0A0N5CC31_STREA